MYHILTYFKFSQLNCFDTRTETVRSGNIRIISRNEVSYTQPYLPVSGYISRHSDSSDGKDQ
jgi:hypothetical protein